ncbi:MAG: ATP-binding protein [Verrucomicrobiales bacterium]|nr:ATP-binding protein [Verrucomicrobiales bacterium]
MAAQMGFSATESAFVASAISELGRNIVSYARQGTVTLKAVHRLGRSQLGILILAKDRGPGILNTALASRGGFSTSGGMGLGLAGVRRLMDEFEIVSQLGKGTTVIAKKWLRKAARLRRGHTAPSSR